MIVKAWRDPNSNISLDEYSYRLVAKVLKLNGLSRSVIGNSLMVSTSTKKKPASILNLICGIIILK